MCRWFAYISPAEECLLEDVLITPAHSISKQVHDHYLPKLISHPSNADITQIEEAEITVRNRLQNVDGFGLAWYTPTRSSFVASHDGPRPSLYKNSHPPTNDFNFHSICANTSTTCLFAHIRAATATAVTQTNNHPFVFGRHTIMHNGVVSHFQDIRRDLLGVLDQDCFTHMQGTTDTEHMAALYMTFLTRSRGQGKAAWEHRYTLSEMKTALESAFALTTKLQLKYLSTTPNSGPLQASSLNFCVTDGSQLVAIRFHNHISEQPPSLYYSSTAGVTLNRKYPDNSDGTSNMDAVRNPLDHGNHVIIASEPTTYKPGDWKLIPKNSAVLVDEKGGVSLEEVEVAVELLATERTLVH